MKHNRRIFDAYKGGGDVYKRNRAALWASVTPVFKDVAYASIKERLESSYYVI